MRLALWAAAATGIQVGSALVASQLVVAEVGAGRLGFLRYAISLAFLLPFMLRSHAPKVKGRDLLPVSLIGMGQFGLLIALLNLAVLNTSSARVSLIFATLPLMTIAVGWLIFRSRVKARELMAILLTILGVAILVGAAALDGAMDFNEIMALSCAALATLTGALCSIFYQPYLKRYGVLQVSVIATAASLVPLGIMALWEGGGTAMHDWSWQIVALVCFIGLSSGVGYMMWLYALKHAPAGLVTGYLALSPITAVLLSVLFLGEVMSLSLLIALFLVIGGLILMSCSSEPVPSKDEEVHP